MSNKMYGETTVDIDQNVSCLFRRFKALKNNLRSYPECFQRISVSSKRPSTC